MLDTGVSEKVIAFNLVVPARLQQFHAPGNGNTVITKSCSPHIKFGH